MSYSPLAYMDSLRIGSVDFVSPDEINVLLDTEAPNSVALNTGTPGSFPRINGYILIPSDSGYLVGQIGWITIERSQYPKRKGMQDAGLVDLPYPLRRMSLSPLGTLQYDGKDEDNKECYIFRRGVESFPSIGDAVILPTPEQLRSIVESGENRRIKIGISPLAANAEVKIDPNRLFGRHLAVLGSTGSGKSCSVAGLIRWSLEAAKKESKGNEPNARFIVLDPNGEYTDTFKDIANTRVFSVDPKKGDQTQQLHVPLWLWNSAEWCAFAQASDKTQRPVLIQALRTVRDGKVETAVSPSHDMRRYLRTLVSITQIERNAGSPWGRYGSAKGFLGRIMKFNEDLSSSDEFSDAENSALEELKNEISRLINNRAPEYSNVYFSKLEVDKLLSLMKTAHSTFGGSDTDTLPIDADTPNKFTETALLKSVEANAEMLNASEYVATMLIRIHTLLSDTRMKNIINDENTSDASLVNWLYEYIGSDECLEGNGKNSKSNSSITVIDLSLLPAEVIHIITAVIARMTFEALQRYRKLHPEKKTLPTVLVMEEAHTFIKRYKDDTPNHDAATVCCQVFEKIAREGRKFGLGLVISSQRPSELSPTVLAQCNSFLLHRISSDRDQELIKKLVPDNLQGLLRDLPSLPSRNAILLGWASELPVLVQMNELKKEHRPKSDDPDFWTAWSKTPTCEVSWGKVADDWQGVK